MRDPATAGAALADPRLNPLGAVWDDVRNSVWDQLLDTTGDHQ